MQHEGGAPVVLPKDPSDSWTHDDWDRMWQPSMWLRKPPNPHVIHAWHIVGIVALTGYANVVANEFLDSLWYIPFNLAILGVAIAIARHGNVTWADIGMWRERFGRGLRVGALVAVLAGVVIAIGVALPFTRAFFEDDRVVDASTATVLFNAFVRIPIATAFYEEMLFRGVLFGMFARKWAPLWAGLASAMLFGLWHILPTIDTLDVNPAGDLFSGILGVVIAAGSAVAATAFAGLVFLWLRLRANSTVASIIAHTALNSLALLGALFVVRAL